MELRLSAVALFLLASSVTMGSALDSSSLAVPLRDWPLLAVPPPSRPAPAYPAMACARPVIGKPLWERAKKAGMSQPLKHQVMCKPFRKHEVGHGER